MSLRSPLLNALHGLINVASGPVPQLLFHYTSAESLKKILETRCLLATHFEFTNDPNELRHGLRVALTTTQQTLATCEGTWAAPVVSNVVAMLENGDLHEKTPNFVTCFSQDGDSLGQWRAYAQDGRGYALGFDTRRWEFEKSNGEGLGLVLVQCCYDETELANELAGQQRRIIERGDLLTREGGPLSAETNLDFEKAILVSAAYACLRLKHVGFKDESEWRLVALPRTEAGKPDCQFVREAGGVFAPAVKVLLRPEGERLPIRRIVMGPYHAQEVKQKIAAYGLRELLRLTGCDASNEGFIKSSRIPYRPRL